MGRTIRIATAGVADDYRQSLVPLIIQNLGYEIEWTRPGKADLVIFGPFFKPQREQRWVPRPLRHTMKKWLNRMQSVHRPITLFQTGENLRHDHIPCDFALSFDLAIADAQHHRFPYWMEMVDWSHEGITGNTNPRFGRLLDLRRLMQPLGHAFLSKPSRAAIFASHLREPRTTLVRVLRKHIDVAGFGLSFDEDVKHHSKSSYTKFDVLQDFAFNLCPENSMYPGYYTEKIPEAFASDTLPLVWADSNVKVDFNPEAFINLAPLMKNDFVELPDMLTTKSALEAFCDEPLLLYRPTISPIRDFIAKIINSTKY